MTTKKEILDSVLVRRCIYHRIIGLGNVLNYLEKKGELPPVHKEGVATHMEDNGGLFMRTELIAEDLQYKKINLQPFEGSKPTAKELEKIVDTALDGEKATLLNQEGWASEVLLNNIFYPQIATQILELLAIDKKVKAPKGSKILEEHIPISYLPHPHQGEEIRYSCRTELTSYLAVCSAFWRRYAILTGTHLKPSDRSTFLKKLEHARTPIKNEGQILFPSFIIHCHNSRLFSRSLVAPISILGYGHRFGEFSMISFEESSSIIDDLKILGKKGRLNYQDALNYQDVLETKNNKSYYCVLRIFSKTNPGRRPPRKKVMVISPERDLKLTNEQVSEAIKKGYEQV